MSVSSQRFIARHRAPRVQLQYTIEVLGSDKVVQLPFVTGVLADLSGNASAVAKPEMSDRKLLDIDMDNFDKRMAAIEPAVAMKVANKLRGEGDELSVHLKFTKMDDFSPAAVARQVPSLTKLFDSRQLLSNLQSYMDGKEGARALVEKIVGDSGLMSALVLLGDKELEDSDTPAEIDDRFRNAGIERPDLAALVRGEFGPRTERAKNQIGRALPALARTLQEMPHLHGIEVQTLIPAMVAELDDAIGVQLNQVLHHRDFQEIEGAWRGLHYLVSRTETDEMLKIRVLNVGKDELYHNLRIYPRAMWDKSPLFKAIYESEFGTLGGEPYGALVADYSFSHQPKDVQLLLDLSKIASASLAPLVTGADPKLLGMDSWRELMNPRDLGKLMDTPEYAAWKGLRDRVDSRYVALCMPRVLARLPYGHRTHRVEELDFVEDVGFDDAVKSVDSTKFVWMNSAYLMAVNINRAFKRYGWCSRIHGFEAGAADQLPVYRGPTDDGVGTLGPTEIAITDHREAELANLGFLPLLQRKNADIAAFMSASSLHNPTRWTDPNATAAAQISSKLPFVLASGRFVHYLKCICRDRASSWTHPDEIARFLNEWAKNYVDDNPETSSDAVKAQRPLATAEIVLREIDSNSRNYECRFFIRPHYQFEELPASVRLEVQLPTPTGR
jgi:type VI secretion system protein ImpC